MTEYTQTMKKFLIAVICIIPVIVVLALSVTGDIILQVTAENPNNLRIHRFDDTEVQDGGLIEIDVNDAEDYLVIDVLPGFVQNKEIVWRLTAEEGMAGKVSLEKMEGSTNRYWIRPEEPGICAMEIRPAGNIDVVKTVNFHITTIEVQRFEVYRDGQSDPVATAYGPNSDGEPTSETVKLHGAERFYTSATPFSAFQVLEGDETEWSIGAFSGSSEDGDSAEDYLSVDETGLVTPLKRADATIAVNAYLKSDKTGNSFLATFLVDLSEAVVKSTDAVCLETGKSESEMTAWVKENLVLSPTASVDFVSRSGAKWTFEVSEPLAARAADDVAPVTVTVTESDTNWGISSLPDEIYAGNGNQPFYVVDYSTVNYRSGAVSGERLTDYSVESLNEDILTVDAARGLLKPHKAGVAALVFSRNGQQISVSVTVRERPLTFALSLTNADAERGIARDRVWGNYWLNAENTELITEFGFGLGAGYASGAFDVAWSVSATTANGVPVPEEETEGYISFEQRGQNAYEGITLRFGENAPGSAITVTAKLYMQNRAVEGVQRSFTFKMSEKRNSVNVYDFEDFKAVYKRPTYDYVLQSDIRAAAVSDDFLYDADVGSESNRGDNVFANMMGSIYGNGYLYDATDVKVTKNDQGALSYRYELMLSKLRAMYRNEYGVTPNAAQMKAYFDEVGLGEIRIYNLKMRGAETLEAADNTLAVFSYSLGMYNERDINSADTPRDPPMAIMYCEVYNSERGITIERVNDVLIEGCIFGDNYKHSVFGYNHSMMSRRYPNYYDGDPAKVNTNTDDNRPGYNLTFRNNVFKRSSGPAICLAGTSPTEGETWSDYSVSPNIYIEGSFEIYNWKTREQFRQAIIDLITYYVVGIVSKEGTADQLETVEELIATMLEGIVDAFLGISENDRLYYSYGGDKYIGLGLFGAGCVYGWDPNDIRISSEAAVDAVKAELRMKNADGTLPDALQTLQSLIKMFNVRGLESVSETCWMVCNNFASGAPEIMPDDPVPASEEMYSKLTAAKGEPMPWDKYSA